MDVVIYLTYMMCLITNSSYMKVKKNVFDNLSKIDRKK